MAAFERVRAHAILVAACALAAPLAHAQVYKCTDAAGQTTYADAPCSATSKPLQLADPTKGPRTDPNVCMQLKDETHRLAAETERNAQRGRKETPENAARRHALDQQYAARCMGIARSAAKP